MPAGAIEDWASSPTRRASCLGARVAMSRPSRTTCPASGEMTRLRARSSVDFPQALGPTIMVTAPGVTAVVRSSMTGWAGW